MTVDRVAAVSKACSSGTACPSDDLVGVWANEWELSAVSLLDNTLTPSYYNLVGWCRLSRPSLH